MGNSGSVNNLNFIHNADNNNNNNASSNDLYAYYLQQQHFQHNKRQHTTQLLSKYGEIETGAAMNKGSVNQRHSRLQQSQRNSHSQDWATKSLPHMSQITQTGSNMQWPQYKVLPQLSERDIFKLRSTTNGSILHSGGTISGRKKNANSKKGSNINNATIDEMQKNRHSLPLPMQLQRSSTVIYDVEPMATRGPTLTGEQQRQQLLLLRQAQTALELPSRTVQVPTYLPTVQKRHPQDTKKTAGIVMSNRMNQNIKNNYRYKKKRKAPNAPNVTQTLTTTQTLTGVSGQATTRLFRTQCNKQSVASPQTATETTNPAKHQQQDLRHPLLRKYNSQIVYDTSTTNTDNNNNNSNNNNRNANDKLHLPFQCEKSSNQILVRKNNLKGYSPVQRSSNIATPEPMSNKFVAVKASKIPQLKQTFYFGMSKSAILKHRHAGQFSSSVKLLSKLPADPSSSIDDSGLLVHMYPTLPRRQRETPSFSPTCAWRTLGEKQQHIQPSFNGRQHANLNMYTGKQEHSPPEQPIQIQHTEKDADVVSAEKNKLQYLLAWTPQQDLEDDDDDGDLSVTMKIAHATEMQCDIVNLLPINQSRKRSNNNGDSHSSNDEINAGGTTDRQHKFNTVKSSKSSLKRSLHVFNLSLPRDTYTNFYLKQIINDKFENPLKYHEPLMFGTGDNDTKESVSLNFRNDNWMLYKSDGTCSSFDVINKNHGTHITAQTIDWSTLPASIEPHSLTSLTAGKHVMYLPSANAPNHNQLTKIYRSCTEVPKTVLRLNRESLQDEEQVFRRDVKINAEYTDKTQRFSFQSTLRLLEKRRLGKKLAKKVELEEARRISEQEAMKRVEENFQRKRFTEKANIRNKLFLYFSHGAAADLESSDKLTDGTTKFAQLTVDRPQLSDNNSNNETNSTPRRRTDPEGAVASQISHDNATYAINSFGQEFGRK